MYHRQQQPQQHWQRRTQFVPLLLLLLFNISATFGSATSIFEVEQDLETEKLLSRKRRYVAFPDGSSVAASICLTTGVIGNPNTAYLSWAENWGVAYNLPNYTWAKEHAHGFKNGVAEHTPAVLQRRARRGLYSNIETIIENMGYDGAACIGRALCESAKYLHGRRRGNMLEEIVKTIFSLPHEPVHAHEPQIMLQYDRIYRRARRETRLDCEAEYADCAFSLLELVFADFTLEPVKHGTASLLGLKEGRFM